MQPPKDICCIYGVAFSCFVHTCIYWIIFLDADCSSKGREFDPGPVPNLGGGWSWNHLFCHSAPSADSKKLLFSYMRSYVHKGLVNRLVQLAKENVWLDELTISHDHSCWLRHKESKQTKYNFSRGNSSRPKHMRMDAKTVIYSALVPCYKFSCHVLQVMETYGSIHPVA